MPAWGEVKRFIETTDGLLKKLGGAFRNFMAFYITNYLLSLFLKIALENQRVFTWEKRRERLGFGAEKLRIVLRCLVIT